MYILPVSIPERSKARTVYDRLNIEIAGSNPARGMDVCMFLCCVVLFVGRGLELDWSPNQGVLPNVCGSRSPLRKAKVR
jgi:hypothetical protein